MSILTFGFPDTHRSAYKTIIYFPIILTLILGIFIPYPQASEKVTPNTLTISLEKTSAKAMLAMERRFGAISELLYLYPVKDKGTVIQLGFPGELIVAPDKTKLADLLTDTTAKINISAEPETLVRLFLDDVSPAAKVVDNAKHLVGIIATQSAMEPFRTGAIVKAPLKTEAAGIQSTRQVDESSDETKNAPTDSDEKTHPVAHPPNKDDTAHKPYEHLNEKSDAEVAVKPHKRSQPQSGHDDTAKAGAKSSEKSTTRHLETAGHSDPAHPPEAAETHAEAGHGPSFDPSLPRGVALIEAITQPLDYELNQRFWGWRPNDLIGIGDNVINFQLGVLEITRRTAIILSERVSRTGESAAFDPQLENAMNWLMIKPNRYWFPSAESKYQDALDALNGYKERLAKKQAKFFNRADNLIPLLMAYEDLLGSCEENLVKQKEEDGVPVSFYKADDYVYYTKGVTSALLTILTAIEHDFADIIASRQAQGDIHHAITSCLHVVEIDPLIIVNSDPSSIFANHRANQAAPLSHARFYLSVLVKTLST